MSLSLSPHPTVWEGKEEKVLATLISLAALSLLAHPHTPSQIKQMNGEEAAESSSQG